jgi:hypothetical protein
VLIYRDFHEICGNSRYENIKLLLGHVEDKIKTFGFFHVDDQDQVRLKFSLDRVYLFTSSIYS